MPLFDTLAAFTGVGVGPLLAAMVITAVAATVQGTVGMGFGLISVPTLAMLDPRLSPVPQVILALPLVIGMLWSERHGVDWAGFGQIVLGRLPGAALGALLVEYFARAHLELMMAAIIGLAVAIAVRNSRATAMADAPPPSAALRFAAGWVSGTSSYVASIGGPPIALLYRNAGGPTLRATLAAVFLVGLSITIVSRTAAGHIGVGDVRVAAALVPFVVLGFVVSRTLRGRVEGRWLRTAVLAISGLAALALGARNLVG